MAVYATVGLILLFVSLRIMLCAVRAGDEGRISGVIPGMGQVMSLCVSIHGYGHVMCALL